jgi:hypothetical protein
LNNYIKNNSIKISSYDLINVVCTKCKIKESCPDLPVKFDER